MPTYDFKCKECGGVSEFLLKSPTDTNPLSCPECGSSKMEKLLSAPSLLKDNTGRAAQQPEGNSGTRCCGREERCDKPPCSSEDRCCGGH